MENHREVERQKVVPRDFQFEEFGNYIFVGIRRASKSFLMYQRMQQLLANGCGWDEMLYVNFEDERLDGMKATDLNSILECHIEEYGKRPMLFLDEIQVGEICPTTGQSEISGIHHRQQCTDAEHRDDDHAWRKIYPCERVPIQLHRIS